MLSPKEIMRINIKRLGYVHTFCCLASSLKALMVHSSKSTNKYSDRTRSTDSINGKAQWSKSRNSYSVMYFGKNFGMVVSVRQRNTSNTSMAISTIIIHVEDNLQLFGIVTTYERIPQYKYVAPTLDKSFKSS